MADASPTSQTTADFLAQLAQIVQGGGNNTQQAASRGAITQAPAQGGSYGNGAISQGALSIAAPTRAGGGINYPAGTQVIDMSHTGAATANDMQNMMNEAMRIGQSGSTAAPTPYQGMSSEDYMSVVDMIQSMNQRQSLQNQLNTGLGQVAGVYNQALTNPLMQKAVNAADSTVDFYNPARASYEAQTTGNARNLGYEAQGRGMAGSSATQLAAQQQNSNRASDLANIFLQSKQAEQAYTTAQQDKYLKPLAMQQQAGSDYTNAYAQMMGVLSPNATSLWLNG